MSTVQVSKEINAPIDKVFEGFSDLENVVNVVADIVKLELLTEGPVGLGTRWRETRVMFNKEATEEMEITAFEPPKSYTAEARSHGMHYLTEYRFVEKDGGTEVTLAFNATPLTFLAKVMNLFLAPIMRRTLVKCLEKDMDDLKTHLESGETEPAASQA